MRTTHGRTPLAGGERPTVAASGRRIGIAALALAVGATTLVGQPLARRVGSVTAGTVRMSFAARADVCGNGRGSISSGNQRWSGANHRDEWDDECQKGPVRVALDLVGAKVVAVRTYVGGRWRSAGSATDLGTVGVGEATDFLLDVVARGQGRAARDAIFPATIADSVVVWPRLLALAKDESREKEVRRQSVFWVSQAAGEKATEGLAEVIGDAAADQDVRIEAVFALSQRPREEGTTALLNVARTNRDPKIRKQAVFWLGQSRDPRALEYFESVLVKR